MSKRLEGKVAIITGSTFGIGRTTAKLFAEHGAEVVVNGRTAPQGEEVVGEIKAAGGEASFFHADLTEKGAVQGLVEFAVEKYGRLDIMMNNAYTPLYRGVLDISEEEWAGSMSILLTAVFLGCKYAIPHLIDAGGGAIINTSSVHGYLAARNSANYETAKAAIINLTRQVAVDFGPKGVRANAICPGGVEIERSKRIFDEHPEYRRLTGLMYPRGHHGATIEIAHAALFLASDDSSFVTGHALVVDGGMTAQLHDMFFPGYEAYYREHLAQEWSVAPEKAGRKAEQEEVDE